MRRVLSPPSSTCSKSCTSAVAMPVTASKVKYWAMSSPLSRNLVLAVGSVCRVAADGPNVCLVGNFKVMKEQISAGGVCCSLAQSQ